MRTVFEQLVKQVVREAASPAGAIETEAEVSPDAQRVDLWFNPDPARLSHLAPFGLLGRICRRACTLEAFHRPPGEAELLACLRKHLGFRHVLSLREPPPPAPLQWVISAGRPASAISGLRLQRSKRWGPGIYQAAPWLRTYLLVVNELPVRRDTLLVRLMGAGHVLRQAIAEIAALPEDAPERRVALPVLLRLRFEIPTDPAQRTNEDEEFLMSTHDVVETWKQRMIEQGVARGMRQGLEQGVAASLLDAYAARFGTTPPDLAAKVSSTHDEATLRTWLKLVVTLSPDEIAAALGLRPASR